MKMLAVPVHALLWVSKSGHIYRFVASMFLLPLPQKECNKTSFPHSFENMASQKKVSTSLDTHFHLQVFWVPKASDLLNLSV